MFCCQWALDILPDVWNYKGINRHHKSAKWKFLYEVALLSGKLVSITTWSHIIIWSALGKKTQNYFGPEKKQLIYSVTDAIVSLVIWPSKLKKSVMLLQFWNKCKGRKGGLRTRKNDFLNVKSWIEVLGPTGRGTDISRCYKRKYENKIRVWALLWKIRNSLFKK